MICPFCNRDIGNQKVFQYPLSGSRVGHSHYEVTEFKPYDFPLTRILGDIKDEEFIKSTVEDNMEKYGVDTGANPGEKIAAATGKCPRCGMELDKDAPVPKCPVHGTEPWERRPGEER